MGLHIGLPKLPGAVSSALNEAKHLASKAVDTAEHPLRTAKHLAGTLGHDGFELANQAVRYLTSEPGKHLVKHELALAKLAQDPARAPAEREACRTQLRRMMGAEPETALDPLPEAASSKAEKARARTARVWSPGAAPSTKKAQWATNDPAGTRKSDPVNLYVHGKLADIVRSFQKAGWSIASAADHAGNEEYAAAMKGYLKEAAEAALIPGLDVSQETYHKVNRMPVGNLYLNGKPPLISMEANNHPLSGRDHFRIFATGRKDAAGNNIYAVTASRDEGIKLDLNRKKTAYTNHFTEQNADAERDFTLSTLLASGAKVSVSTLGRSPAGGPKHGLTSQDGKVYDLVVHGS